MQSKELSDTCLGRGHTSVAAHALPVDRLSIASFSVLLIAVQGMGPLCPGCFLIALQVRGQGRGPITVTRAPLRGGRRRPLRSRKEECN